MKINTKDVVKNVESNNVESTSNEQRQTNKPIVISRRRLLRAGVAGIPVVLTMAGVAPGIEGINAASAASGMNYDRLGTVGRISQVQAPDNGLIWSDEDGFVLTSQNGDYVKHPNGLKYESGTATATVSGLTFTTTADVTPNSIPASATLTLNPGAIIGNPRLHKLGNYYISLEDISFESSQLSGNVGESKATIVLDSSDPVTFDLSNWDSETSNGTDWYCLTEGNATTDNTIQSVTIKVESLSIVVTGDTTATFTCTPPNGIVFTFTNVPVTISVQKLQ